MPAAAPPGGARSPDQQPQAQVPQHDSILNTSTAWPYAPNTCCHHLRAQGSPIFVTVHEAHEAHGSQHLEPGTAGGGESIDPPQPTPGRPHARPPHSQRACPGGVAV